MEAAIAGQIYAFFPRVFSPNLSPDGFMASGAMDYEKIVRNSLAFPALACLTVSFVDNQ